MKHFVIKTILVIADRHLIDVINIIGRDNSRFTHVTETRNLAAFIDRNFTITPAQKNIRLNTNTLQFLDGMLGWFGFKLTGR